MNLTVSRGILRNPWLWLLLLWMGVIFGASGDASSMHHSSRILGPLLRWVLPHGSEEAIAQGIFVARKCAHLAEYAILAMLAYATFRRAALLRVQPVITRELAPAVPAACPSSRPPRLAWKSIALVALYAISDEVHQSFVPNRLGSPVDVLIDVAGGALGLLFLLTVQRHFLRFRTVRPS